MAEFSCFSNFEHWPVCTFVVFQNFPGSNISLVNDSAYENIKKHVNSCHCEILIKYTLSEAWSGVNWANLMAAQGAFGTDFYDRYIGILRPKHRAYYRSGRPVIKIGPKGFLVKMGDYYYYFSSFILLLRFRCPHPHCPVSPGCCCCCSGSGRHFALDVGHIVGPLNHSRCDT